MPDLRLTRFGRHDVTTSTQSMDERGESATPGVVAGQPKIWTFIDFEGPNEIADDLARAFADALEPELGWWADFRIDDAEHVVIFAGRIFRYRVGDEAGRAEAVAWGRAHGTPDSQLDWR